jgi:hypothetical protein
MQNRCRKNTAEHIYAHVAAERIFSIFPDVVTYCGGTHFFTCSTFSHIFSHIAAERIFSHVSIFLHLFAQIAAERNFSHFCIFPCIAAKHMFSTYLFTIFHFCPHFNYVSRFPALHRFEHCKNIVKRGLHLAGVEFVITLHGLDASGTELVIVCILDGFRRRSCHLLRVGCIRRRISISISLSITITITIIITIIITLVLVKYEY